MTAVGAAGVLPAAVMPFIVMVVAGGAVGVGQGAGQQLAHPVIGAAGAAGVKPEARGMLRTKTDNVPKMAMAADSISRARRE